MGCSKSSFKREVYNNKSYLKKQEKHRTDNLTLHLEQLEKKEIENPKISRRKEIIKIQTEKNKKERKKE